MAMLTRSDALVGTMSLVLRCFCPGWKEARRMESNDTRSSVDIQPIVTMKRTVYHLCKDRLRCNQCTCTGVHNIQALMELIKFLM